MLTSKSILFGLIIFCTGACIVSVSSNSFFKRTNFESRPIIRHHSTKSLRGGVRPYSSIGKQQAPIAPHLQRQPTQSFQRTPSVDSFDSFIEDGPSIQSLSQSVSSFNIHDVSPQIAGLTTKILRLTRPKSFNAESLKDVIERLPHIIDKADQVEVMEFVLRTIKGTLCYKLVGKMLRYGWVPTDSTLELAVRKHNLFAIRLFLDSGISFSHQQQNILSSLFRNAMNKKSKAERLVVELLIFNNARIPGAEKAAVEFLLSDDQIDENAKYQFLIQSIFQTIENKDMSLGALTLALEQKRFQWVSAMLQRGWIKVFSKEELKSIRDSKNEELISVMQQLNITLPEKKHFWDKIFN